jgi:hypothetical protein
VISTRTEQGVGKGIDGKTLSEWVKILDIVLVVADE